MPTSSSADAHLTTLKTFRQTVYESGFGKARDALFELGDAVLLTPRANSFAEFSLQPSFRRGWPMLYETLQDGVIYRVSLMAVYTAQVPRTVRPLLAGDHTAWSRLHARTLRERTVEHQPNAIPNAKPITVGQGYSTLVWLPETQGSWALPCLHERIAPTEHPIGKAVTQLRQVCQRLPQRPLRCSMRNMAVPRSLSQVRIRFARPLKLCAFVLTHVCAARHRPMPGKVGPTCMARNSN